jgi:hypothetical protein
MEIDWSLPQPKPLDVLSTPWRVLPKPVDVGTEANNKKNKNYNN